MDAQYHERAQRAGDMLPQVTRYARRLVSGNAADADDVAQETILKALRDLQRNPHNFDSAIDTPNGMRAYLFTILRRAAIDHHRRALPPTIPSGFDVASDDADMLDVVLQKETAHDVQLAIKRLPTPERQLMRATLKGKQQTEYAQSVNLSRGAIRYRAWSARRRMREYLERKGYSEKIRVAG